MEDFFADLDEVSTWIRDPDNDWLTCEEEFNRIVDEVLKQPSPVPMTSSPPSTVPFVPAPGPSIGVNKVITKPKPFKPKRKLAIPRYAAPAEFFPDSEFQQPELFPENHVLAKQLLQKAVHNDPWIRDSYLCWKRCNNHFVSVLPEDMCLSRYVSDAQHLRNVLASYLITPDPVIYSPDLAVVDWNFNLHALVLSRFPPLDRVRNAIVTGSVEATNQRERIAKAASSAHFLHGDEMNSSFHHAHAGRIKIQNCFVMIRRVILDAYQDRHVPLLPWYLLPAFGKRFACWRCSKVSRVNEAMYICVCRGSGDFFSDLL